MSNVIVGNMLKVHCKQVEEAEVVMGCSKCRIETHNAFCHLCGGRIDNYTRTYKNPFNVHGFLFENFEEDKYCAFQNDEEDVMFIIMNWYDEYVISIEKHDNVFYRFPPVAPEDYLKEVKDKLSEAGISSEIIYGVNQLYR